MLRDRRKGLTIRAALLVALALTTGLWFFSGYSLARRMADMRRQADGVNARYMRAQELLSTVRSQVLLGSVYIRDALLDPNPGATSNYRRQFDDSYRVVLDALDTYDPFLDSAPERPQVDHLRREVDEFRAAMLEVIASDSTRWPAEARLLIRSRIMPKRESVISVSEGVQALNRGIFVKQQAATAAAYAATQARVWNQLGFALLGSSIIGLFAIRHVGALEQRLRHQNEREAGHTRDLQQLSTQLLTAQEDERRTIARELHDEVGQVLTAIKVELALAERTIESIGGSPQTLSNARAITDQALRTVRDLSHLLHPAVLDDLGLPAALETYVRDVSARHCIDVELLHEHMDQRLSPALETTVYRIVQEALTNVVRHAHASRCRVYLQQLPHSVVITVEDNGAGFDTQDIERRGARAGIGILGIRERAAQLRGTTRIESIAGKGTRLTVELPQHDRPHDDARSPSLGSGSPEVARA